MSRLLQRLLTPLHQFVFPPICGGCGRRLGTAEEGICIACRSLLEPYEAPWRLLDERFASFIVHIDSLHAGYVYNQESIGRSLIHSIKYHRNRAAGLALGRLLAKKERIDQHDFDLIVPIPIHYKRYAERGYNQAEVIAQGVRQITKIPIAPQALKRTHWQTSQTRRTRSERTLGVRDAFAKGKQFPQEGLRLLLVDDVLTTGATLAEAAKVLLLSHPKRLSILVATVDI